MDVQRFAVEQCFLDSRKVRVTVRPAFKGEKKRSEELETHGFFVVVFPSEQQARRFAAEARHV